MKNGGPEILLIEDDAGANSFISKPFGPDPFSQVVQAAISFWCMTAKPPDQVKR